MHRSGIARGEPFGRELRAERLGRVEATRGFLFYLWERTSASSVESHLAAISFFKDKQGSPLRRPFQGRH
jgi:hypothetical protein